MTIQELATQGQDLSAADVTQVRDKLQDSNLDISCDPDGTFGGGHPDPDAWVDKVLKLSNYDYELFSEEMNRRGHVRPSRLVRST